MTIFKVIILLLVPMALVAITAGRQRGHLALPSTPSIGIRPDLFAFSHPLSLVATPGPHPFGGSGLTLGRRVRRMQAAFPHPPRFIHRVINDNKECRPVASFRNVTENLTLGIRSERVQFRQSS